MLDPFHDLCNPLLMLQQYRHHNRLKRPWTSDHDPSLDVQLGAVKEPIGDRLKGAKRRKRLAHGSVEGVYRSFVGRGSINKTWMLQAPYLSEGPLEYDACYGDSARVGMGWGRIRDETCTACRSFAWVRTRQ